MSKIFDFPGGELLLIDKPISWTSFDVVNKIRLMLKHYLGIKKIKVGHAGTLDPLASGLLVICTGKFTKRIQDLAILDKEYTGTIQLGAVTPSFDKETEITKTFDTSQLTTDMLEAARIKLTGDIEQVPPMFSAIKIDGKRAYMYARDNQEVVMPAKQVCIHEFEFKNVTLPDIDFRIACSKGTYIRSLARDLGELLDNGGYLTALRRTRIGEFLVNDALTIEQFESLLEQIGKDQS